MKLSNEVMTELESLTSKMKNCEEFLTSQSKLQNSVEFFPGEFLQHFSHPHACLEQLELGMLLTGLQRPVCLGCQNRLTEQRFY